MSKSKPLNVPKMLGEGLFYSSIQSAIGSVEMSSKFSVINFCKDQETLQNAADALRNYIYIAIAWTIGTMLVMYSKYGMYGIISGFAFNMMYILWIYFSYVKSFEKAALKYGLKAPCVFFC